ncbi:NAD(P)/FAD-dependent oxidoreductase [Actinophytocola gossypii]|uniref:FAD-dependent oxidoreductase n=1 Tax=Actinophytocola gossypii TaxID=2812003 RepID=A0ABT2J6L4_9PSEU|nr:FAD-dependent oxidoreductase [Actinophytocola gossypii]MCT2583135.1 FAD-dependent oxidoreductase [Actinophytocola gossypii]
MTEHSTAKVVVIGGGYAGTLAANRLTPGGVDITLVNPRPEFVDRIRLHQYVCGTGEAAVDYAPILGDGVRLLVDTATRIVPAGRVVELASGAALDYDHVIYAVGSTGAPPSSVPGAAEFAYSVAEFEYARRLRARLADAPRDAPVTVVGGGLTGIETAAELAEQGRAVTLVGGGTLAPKFTESARRSILKWLARNGVAVLEDDVVTEVRAEAVVLGDGAVRPSAVTVWTAGFGVPELARASGLRTDPLGRLLTDETLTSVDDDRVVAAGDCAAPSGEPLRMSCYAAGPLGAQAADTILRRLAGTEPAPLGLAFSGACVSLGRRAGVRQFARKDDTAIDFHIGGRLGGAIKNLTYKFGVLKVGREARKPGSRFWLKGTPRPQRTAATPS